MMILGESVTFKDTGDAIQVTIVRREWHLGAVSTSTTYGSEGRRVYACSRAHDWALREMRRTHLIDEVFDEFNKYPGVGKTAPPELRDLSYEDLTPEQCEQAMKWLNEQCIERRLDLELEHQERSEAGSS